MALIYGPVAVFLVAGFVFAAITLVFAMILRPADQYDEKRMVYECGIPPIGPAWSRFFVRYYVIAIVFVIFEIETIFLFPWATVFKALSKPDMLGALPAGEMGIFVAILLVGLAYVWKKGDLRWT
ncbi:MAG: NADH-quinone oxidoreductase subunit A [Armatimonadetes bacterium]|nr:NADH-quinone oxidoreductase subunit A [Armatimonadota bacterium]